MYVKWIFESVVDSSLNTWRNIRAQCNQIGFILLSCFFFIFWNHNQYSFYLVDDSFAKWKKNRNVSCNCNRNCDFILNNNFNKSVSLFHSIYVSRITNTQCLVCQMTHHFHWFHEICNDMRVKWYSFRCVRYSIAIYIYFISCINLALF